MKKKKHKHKHKHKQTLMMNFMFEKIQNKSLLI